MKNDNEAKMKAILNELEDELSEEKVENIEEIEELTNDELKTNEDDFSFDEEGVVVEDKKAIEIEPEEDDSVQEDIEVEDVESEVQEDDSKEEETEEETKEVAEEPEEKIETKKEEKEDKSSDKEESSVKESPIRKFGSYLIDKLNKYKYVIILDIAVFLFLFFLIPTIILEVKPVIWMTLFLVFIIIPTVAFYLGHLYQKYQILLSIPLFYLGILSILDNCTIKDLYGITSHGSLDKTPAWVDAIFVTFIIVFFQYVGLTVIDIARKLLKKNRTKKI